MSKAFLRESDFPTAPPLPSTVSPLPPGAKNYLTSAGHDRLQGELTHLLEVDRPPRAANAQTDPESKRELQVLDQRIRYLRESLRTAEVVPPAEHGDGIIRFGSSVTVRDGRDEVARYRIVGVDESDAERGWLSFMSPMARALMNARQGSSVLVSTPAGPARLEVLEVTDSHAG